MERGYRKLGDILSVKKGMCVGRLGSVVLKTFFFGIALDFTDNFSDEERLEYPKKSFYIF